MSTSWLLTSLVSAFLLPPLNLLLVAVAGLVVVRSHPNVGRRLLLGAVALLWILSTPYLAVNGLRALERSVKPVDSQNQIADAIIVLGGGTYDSAPEYGSETVSADTLVRLRYASKLQRETHKPILVTGGRVEARRMKSVLEQDFNGLVRWTEADSENTLDNARYSFRVLQDTKIKRIYLVTQAWHMPRAVKAFEFAGFEVIPAPTEFISYYKVGVLNFLPEGLALYRSWICMHELIGLLWYRLKI